jgi:hypothetical protein
LAWGWRRWLWGPHLRDSAAQDLERWFAGSEVSLEEGDGPAPALVCSGIGGVPLTISHAPQLFWLLLCSVVLVALGLWLYLAARPGTSGRLPIWLVPLLVLLLGAILAATLLWPGLAAALAYGAEPGVVILLFAGLVQLLLHARYRRQIVFLPSFSRSRGGSSLLRNGSKQQQQRPPGEPSTVDAPRGAGSSWAASEQGGG